MLVDFLQGVAEEYAIGPEIGEEPVSAAAAEEPIDGPGVLRHDRGVSAGSPSAPCRSRATRCW